MHLPSKLSLGMAHGVHAAMNMVQPTSLDTPRCGALVEPRIAELLDAHNSVLPSSDPGHH